MIIGIKVMKKKCWYINDYFDNLIFFSVENERQERIKNKNEKFLKDKSFFDLLKIASKEGVSEFKKFYMEILESNKNYK